MDTTKLHFKFSLSFQNGSKCWIWISKHISLVWYVLSTRVPWDKSNGLPWSSGWWRTTRLISDCFSSFLSFFISSYLYLIAFLSCCFPLFSFSFSFYQFWRTTRLISDWFIYSFFSIWFLSYCSYLNAFPYILFLFRSTNDQWAVKDNWVYLRLLAFLCNPLCAVIKEWWHWWRFWNNWNKYILYLLLWKFYFQNRSDLENESESDAMPFQFRSTAISFQTLHFQLCKGTDDN